MLSLRAEQSAVTYHMLSIGLLMNTSADFISWPLWSSIMNMGIETSLKYTDFKSFWEIPEV